jgi:hypothetical protein
MSDSLHKKTFYHKAAIASLYTPLVCWLLGIINSTVILIVPSLKPATVHLARNIVGGFALLVAPVGFILGIIALVGTRKVGTQGILGRAVTGVVLGGFLTYVLLRMLPSVPKEGFH